VTAAGPSPARESQSPRSAVTRRVQGLAKKADRKDVGEDVMRKIMGAGAALAGIVMTLGLVITSGSPAQAANRMQIHKIYYNFPGTDNGSNTSLNGEWVELQNTSGSKISLKGWTLHDAGTKHTYTFGTYTINALGSVKIHTGKGSNTQTNRYWGLSGYVWNNTGDTATLVDNHGNRIDRCSYSDPSEQFSFKTC
jgi:Lamin Tail Domain